MKWYGIKLGYPRLRNFSKKLAIYTQLFRPFTLLPAGLAGILGIILELLSDYGSLSLLSRYWYYLLIVPLALMCGQAIGQAVNQLIDIEIDRINKPYRPLVKKDISEREVMFVTTELIILYIGLSLLVNYIFTVIMLMLLFFAITYSIEPMRTKKRIWINLVWMAISRGLLALLATWVVFGYVFSIKAWSIGIITLLWVFAYQSTKDIPDIEGDKKFHCNTLPVVYGVKKTRTIMTYLGILPIISIVLFVYMNILELAYLLLLLLIPLEILIYKSFNKVSNITENTKSWVYFYSGLGLIYLLSVISQLIVVVM